MAQHKPVSVSILATPDSAASTLYGLLETLRSVGCGWESTVSGEPEIPQFDVKVVAAEHKQFELAGGFIATPDESVEDVENTDLVIVPSFVAPPTAPMKNRDPREFEWLARQHQHGATITSACSGALFLAESGLLDGVNATMHWVYENLFRACYPKIPMRFNQNICVSGENHQIVTSGGATAWQELALYLIARFCGVEFAARSAKFWLMPDHGEVQSPYAALARSIPHEDGVINECQHWLAGHYELANPVSAMVERARLAPTTFARRFRNATGYRPMDYVHALRIEEAKEMLETGNDAIDSIGREVGYEDPASFRRIFKRKVGLTPSIYRRRFGRSRFERYDGVS